MHSNACWPVRLLIEKYPTRKSTGDIDELRSDIAHRRLLPHRRRIRKQPNLGGGFGNATPCGKASYFGVCAMLIREALIIHKALKVRKMSPQKIDIYIVFFVCCSIHDFICFTRKYLMSDLMYNKLRLSFYPFEVFDQPRFKSGFPLNQLLRSMILGDFMIIQ